MSYGPPARRAVICRLNEEQFQYLDGYAAKYRLTHGAALARMLKLARIVEAMPESTMRDDLLFRQMARRSGT